MTRQHLLCVHGLGQHTSHKFSDWTKIRPKGAQSSLLMKGGIIEVTHLVCEILAIENLAQMFAREVSERPYTRH